MLELDAQELDRDEAELAEEVDEALSIQGRGRGKTERQTQELEPEIPPPCSPKKDEERRHWDSHFPEEQALPTQEPGQDFAGVVVVVQVVAAGAGGVG